MKLINSLHVDGLNSGDDTEEVFELYKKSKNFLYEGSWHLRKFQTNSKALETIWLIRTYDIKMPRLTKIFCLV